MIIKVNYESEQPTVSVRELHSSLGIEKRFSAWFEANSQGFIEGEDFSSVLSGTVVNNGAKRDLQDYAMSVDMAKHICLMSRTDRGKQFRQYLIDLQKVWNTPEQVMARALKMADRAIDKLKTDKAALLEDVNRMKPKEIFADAVSASITGYGRTDISAKELHHQHRKLWSWVYLKSWCGQWKEGTGCRLKQRQQR